MTLLIGTKRDTSVVLAADRLWHGYDEQGNFVTGETTKIVAHPRFPLALASSGLYMLPRQGEAVVVSDLLREIVGDITRSSEVTMDAVAERTRRKLHPLVRDALLHHALVPDPFKNRVTIVVGLLHRGRGELGMLDMEHEVTFKQPRGFIGAPDILRDYLSTGAYATHEGLYADHTTNPDRIATHFHELITGSIAEEARLCGGENQEVGGEGDVVIVQGARARIA